MSDFLLAISIGPVQDFISAARRTRDLWFGSYLLSEICKAAAAAIGPKYLIFPGREALAKDRHAANIILAQVPGTPDQFRIKARDAAVAKWKEFVNDVRRDVEEYIEPERWKRQEEGVLEFYAAWAPLTGPAEYSNARRQVMRLLAGRKMCRDFVQWKGEAGVPKSSLDGARESVWLNENATEALNRSLQGRLRLAPKEQLDVVGLVKRLGGGRQPYPSVSRLAADSWLRGLSASELVDLRAVCEPLALANTLGQVGPRHPQFHAFPYEGTAAYRNRLESLAQEAGLSKDRAEDTPRLTAIAALGAEVKKLEKAHGIPDPYLAVLLADGDGMGDLISGVNSRDEHRALSERLIEFAAEAEKIVPRHRGALVYSGGDDVLAFVPADLCVACARELHDAFAKHLEQWASHTPSLSVGIAIGHFMEPLEDLLAYARAAEKAAKAVKGKNALAVHLHSRGGAPVKFSAGWPSNPDKDLDTLFRMYVDGRLPDKAAYDLRLLGKLYEKWPAEANAAVAADATRLLKRKQVASPDPEWTAMREALIDEESVNRTAQMMLVARKLARSVKQAQPAADAAGT